MNGDDFQFLEYKCTIDDYEKKGRRCLKNYLMRNYTRNVTRGFSAWKKAFVRHSTRDKLLKHIIHIHQYRKLFDLVIVAFKNNASTLKKTDKKAVLFELKLKCEEQESYMSMYKAQAEKKHKEIREQLEVRSSDVLKKAIKAGGSTFKANPNETLHYCSNVKDFSKEQISYEDIGDKWVKARG